jgi:hypothetical protein
LSVDANATRAPSCDSAGAAARDKAICENTVAAGARSARIARKAVRPALPATSSVYSKAATRPSPLTDGFRLIAASVVLVMRRRTASERELRGEIVARQINTMRKNSAVATCLKRSMMRLHLPASAMGD